MMASLSDLTHKLAAGARVSDDDARQLAQTTDLVTVGMVAAEARRVHAGEGVTYVRVAEVACAGPEGTAPDGTIALPEGGWPTAAREIRITGTPASADEAIAFVRAVVASAAGCPVTGFSLADVAALGKGQLTELARALADAGLVGVADVPVDRLSKPIEAVAAVIAGGLATPVARWDTAPADPVAALKVVRELQTQTKALRAFAPLPRAATPIADPSSSSGASGATASAPPTGYDSVKLVALARVMLDNVSYIQVDWARHGPKLAQVALLFGASDLDRVSPSDAAPLGHRRAPLEEVQRNITAAFLKPIERDGRFEKVTR
jgi:CofH/MqnC C-terminal region